MNPDRKIMELLNNYRLSEISVPYALLAETVSFDIVFYSGPHVMGRYKYMCQKGSILSNEHEFLEILVTACWFRATRYTLSHNNIDISKGEIDLEFPLFFVNDLKKHIYRYAVNNFLFFQWPLDRAVGSLHNIIDDQMAPITARLYLTRPEQVGEDSLNQLRGIKDELMDLIDRITQLESQ